MSLTPEQIAEMRERHQDGDDGMLDQAPGMCTGCNHPWPCDAARLLDALDSITSGLNDMLDHMREETLRQRDDYKQRARKAERQRDEQLAANVRVIELRKEAERERDEMIHELRIAMHGASAAEHFSPKEMWELSIREVETLRRERDELRGALAQIRDSLQWMADDGGVAHPEELSGLASDASDALARHEETQT